MKRSRIQSHVQCTSRPFFSGHWAGNWKITPECPVFPSRIYEDVEDGGGVWWWWCAENVLWANSLRWLIGTCPLETSATGSMCRTRNSKTSLLFPRPKSTISKYPLFPAISSISRICCKELAETGPQLLGKNNQAGKGWRQQWREHRWRARWSVRSRSFRLMRFFVKAIFLQVSSVARMGRESHAHKKRINNAGFRWFDQLKLFQQWHYIVTLAAQDEAATVYLHPLICRKKADMVDFDRWMQGNVTYCLKIYSTCLFLWRVVNWSVAYVIAHQTETGKFGCVTLLVMARHDTGMIW